MLWRCKRRTSWPLPRGSLVPAGPELVDPVTQSVIGQSHSAASRRVDLLRTDWLQAQRTRSHSSRTPVRATCTSPLVCTCSELKFSLVFLWRGRVLTSGQKILTKGASQPPPKKIVPCPVGSGSPSNAQFHLNHPNPRTPKTAPRSVQPF